MNRDHVVAKEIQEEQDRRAWARRSGAMSGKKMDPLKSELIREVIDTATSVVAAHADSLGVAFAAMNSKLGVTIRIETPDGTRAFSIRVHEHRPTRGFDGKMIV